jgi:hypothetical protein
MPRAAHLEHEKAVEWVISRVAGKDSKLADLMASLRADLKAAMLAHYLVG